MFSDIRKFVCKDCGLACKDSQILKTHYESMHSKLTCPICQMNFVAPHEQMKHLQSHSGWSKSYKQKRNFLFKNLFLVAEELKNYCANFCSRVPVTVRIPDEVLARRLQNYGSLNDDQGPEVDGLKQQSSRFPNY